MVGSFEQLPAVIRAASYVRMSTDHQRYSTENQADAILSYAEQHGMRVVRTYRDDGKSGLTLDGRKGLQRFLEDVCAQRTDFEVLLVYDVSRWGRFQDADESAYYEFLCRRAGVQVVYCAEPFDNDGSPLSTVLKSLKRAMAGEYSRELSVKVFVGQSRIIRRGYRLGGAAGTGLRRLLIDANGAPKATLGRGERKSIHTDRSILVPGPPEEVETVRRIYRLFLENGLGESAIAARLNYEGVKTDLGRSWNPGVVYRVLTNEKYIGHNVYNRRSRKLKRPCMNNPRDQWIRADDVFTPLIDKDQFERVQLVIRERMGRFTRAELIEGLQRLHAEAGMVSEGLIDAHPGLATSATYRRRFGDIFAAYRAAGLKPFRDYRYVGLNAAMTALRPTVIAQIIEGLEAVGGEVEVSEPGNRLRLNGEINVVVLVASWAFTRCGHDQWQVRTPPDHEADLTVVIRLDHANGEPLDYYLFPKLAALGRLMLFTQRSMARHELYRFNDLSALYALAAREPASAVA